MNGSRDKLPSEVELCKLFGVVELLCKCTSRLAALDGKTRPGDGAYVKMVDDTASFNRLVPVVFEEY